MESISSLDHLRVGREQVSKAVTDLSHLHRGGVATRHVLHHPPQAAAEPRAETTQGATSPLGPSRVGWKDRKGEDTSLEG